METIDKLDKIVARLKDIPQVGRNLANEVENFKRDYARVLQALGRCEDIYTKCLQIVKDWMPRGKNLAREVWRIIETYGLWDEDTHLITDALDEVVKEEQFIKDMIDALLRGCKQMTHDPYK